MNSGTVVLDNIPLYARGIAPGDELVVTANAEGEIWFQTIYRSGGASVFRIHTSSDLDVAKIREELLRLSMPSEADQSARLIAFEIPMNVDIGPVLSYLVIGHEAGWFDFEEAALRHAIQGLFLAGGD